MGAEYCQLAAGELQGWRSNAELGGLAVDGRGKGDTEEKERRLRFAPDAECGEGGEYDGEREDEGGLRGGGFGDGHAEIQLVAIDAIYVLQKDAEGIGAAGYGARVDGSQPKGSGEEKAHRDRW